MERVSEKLVSRKFWLALAACLYFGLIKSPDNIAQIVIAYLAVQAGVDAFESYTYSRYEAGGVGSAVGGGGPPVVVNGPGGGVVAPMDDGEFPAAGGWTGSTR